MISKIYDQKLTAGDLAAIELLKGMSPVAWRNVNLFGNLEFSQSEVEIDLDSIATTFGDPATWAIIENELAESDYE